LKTDETIRRWHRWLSMVFTLAVVANLLVMGQARIAPWVGLATLVPLFALMASGLYLFLRPHAARWRRGRGRRTA
jgi:hypothetical protein